MNRLITSDVKQVTPDRLPPVQRQGPARMLFINTLSVGFTTQARQLKKYTANRDDIDAVQFDI
ncbi:MAG TPA: hypothetical protein VG722_09420, partial [Tepidisphaeraceae bacterium]|nr:hypothetical protein [Tepidisphaeraceae bacterium]